MCDALPHVTRLSKCFQLAKCDYSIIPKMLSTTITSLNQMKTVNGVNLNALPTLLDQLKADGIDVKKPVHLSERYFQDSISEPFLKLLIENIEKRFEDKSVLTAFSVFDPAKLPRNRRIPDNPERELLESQTIMNYGNTEIETLSKHFDGTGALGSSEICLEEWTGYRQFLRENENTRSHGDVIKHLCTNTSSAQVFPNMSALGQICRVVPIHTADVERTFSQLKLVKTRVRNRMTEETLDALLRIAIEGPDLKDLSLKEVVVLWGKKRRISHT